MRSMVKYAQQIKALSKHFPWIYKTTAQMYIDKKYPRHIFLETTAACNLSCSYCPRQRVDSHMDYQMFKRIIREASGFGPRSFSLHLFGEPLLWPDLIRGIEFIKRQNKKHVVLITTNGVHLNRFADDLVKLGCDEIIWTWRMEAKFKKKTLETLRKSSIFRVRIIKEITPKKEIERWSTWPKVEIRSMHNYGGEIDLSQFGVQSAIKRWPCYHLWFAPAVAWNGNILLCCADPHQRMVIGNIKEVTLSEAWRSTQLEQERNKHRRGEFKGICERCDTWKNYPDIFFSWQRTTSYSSKNSI